MPATLIESELFGHEKGAFTGAEKARRGLFREADSGTMLLDEIGELDAAMQGKLLRVLQERQVRPVGSDAFVGIDVRILAATNKELEAEVARGRFRQDLYWRLSVVPICVPPLRERREDLPLLAEHILSQQRAAPRGKGKKRWPARVDRAALAKLVAYPWPGNVRELENVLSRAAILCDADVLGPDDLPPLARRLKEMSGIMPPLAASLGGTTLRDRVRRAVRVVEEQAILEALEQTQGSAVRAAQLLGLSRAATADPESGPAMTSRR